MNWAGFWVGTLLVVAALPCPGQVRSSVGGQAPVAGDHGAKPSPLPDTPKSNSEQPEKPPPSHAGLTGATPSDESSASPEIPAGTVDVSLVNGEGAPLYGIEVRLGVIFERIAEGETRSERFATTDAEGKARFSHLAQGTEHSYRITVRSGPAQYASPPFNLREVGQRVRLHILPVTSSLREALIGMRGFIYIEPREDVFQLEVLFRIFNVGNTTWVPEALVLQLPRDFKAFKAGESMFDARFEALEARGAKLLGTYPPGQRDVTFRFQVPRENQESMAFRFSLLPHTAELRVIAEASPNMGLEVPGFEAPEVATNQNGQRVLVARRLMDRGESEQRELQIQLTGLPVTGSGRWVAVFLAVGLAGAGLAAGPRNRKGLSGGLPATRSEDLTEARELLLNELVALERSYQKADLGPRTYQETRRQLLDALTRVLRVMPEQAAEDAKPQNRSRKARAPASG